MNGIHRWRSRGRAWLSIVAAFALAGILQISLYELGRGSWAPQFGDLYAALLYALFCSFALIASPVVAAVFAVKRLAGVYDQGAALRTSIFVVIAVTALADFLACVAIYRVVRLF